MLFGHIEINMKVSTVFEYRNFLHNTITGVVLGFKTIIKKFYTRLRLSTSFYGNRYKTSFPHK